MERQPEVSASSKTSYSFGCCSWPATAFTVLIVAIRAFQPNAEPMSAWSGWSWFLMTLPMTLPVICWFSMLVLAMLAAAFSSSNRRM